jgi:hypothetical protein
MHLACEAMKKADRMYSDRAYLFKVSDFYSSVFRTATEYRNSVEEYSTTTHA